MNYSGIAFVVLFFPGSALLACWIERKMDRREKPANPSAPGFVHSHRFDFHNSRTGTTTPARPSNRDVFRAINTAPVPKHVHILDTTRDNITITDAGGIHARCIVAGCEEAVYISPTLASLHIGQLVEAGR